MVKYNSVTEFNKDLKNYLDQGSFSYFEIKGEISSLKIDQRGHHYFTLKDERSSISCIMFQSLRSSLTFKPKDGDQVLISGKINFYEVRGDLSIQVLKMSLSGIGDLYQKFLDLKDKLSKLGIFDTNIKKSIPKFPKTIGVITSETGAVIEDITKTVQKRYPLAKIVLFPSLVQGDSAKEMLVQKINDANSYPNIDVIILGRGGGSLEDLWPFNEEDVVLAIYQSKIPIITAIGHETDTTLSDFASDLRASTPTGAAMSATPDKIELINDLIKTNNRLTNLFENILNEFKTKIMHLDHRLFMQSPSNKLKELNNKVSQTTNNLKLYYKILIDSKKRDIINLRQSLISPNEKIINYKNRYKELNLLLNNQINEIFKSHKNKLNLLTKTLNLADPYQIMEKGYIFVEDDLANPLTFHNINIGDYINLRFKEGLIKTNVIKKEKNKNGKQ